MITTISLANFLSHKKSQIDFSPGVNVIVGPTDSGKSAIIKALKWVILNRPLGDGMRSSWGGETFVEIIVDDFAIARAKEDNVNSYLIDDSRFNAVKGDVPIEVQQALNMTDINIQTQFDAHFLLSSTPGEVAQYFNKAAHLDRIDVALQNIQKWTKDVSKKLEYNRQALTSSQERLNDFNSLGLVESILITLEEKEKARQTIEKDRIALQKIIDSLTKIDTDLEEFQFLQDLEQSVNSILELITKKKEVTKELIQINNLIKKNDQIDEEILAVDQDLEEYEAEFHEHLGEGSICPLCQQEIK
jgi:exonuclease SbcC